jgi:predicted GNAT family N-acyltransferase
MAEFVLLNKGHLRNQFESGNFELDNYLRLYARQDQKRGASQTWVLINPDNPFQIEAYYSMSAHSVVSDQLRFPYQAVPAILLGRLAVSRSSQGKSYGRIAVIDALLRSKKISTEIGLRFLLVQPINQDVEAFYQKLGFTKLTDSEFWFFDLNQL